MNEVPDGFAETLVQQMFDTWITPYIESGAADVAADQVRQALVVMPPDGPVEVLLNEHATLEAEVRVSRDLATGEQMSENDIDGISGLRPFDIDPAAGWMAFATLPGGEGIASFDFRRDRPRVHEHLVLARDYLTTAREAVAAGRPGPAVEAGFAAAELAVKAMHLLHVFPVKKRASHKFRLTWLNWYTVRDGNGSPEWFPAMRRLESLRPAARYSESGSLPSAEELGALVDQVAELVDHVAERGDAGVEPCDPEQPARIRPAG